MWITIGKNKKCGNNTILVCNKFWLILKKLLWGCQLRLQTSTSGPLGDTVVIRKILWNLWTLRQQRLRIHSVANVSLALAAPPASHDSFTRVCQLMLNQVLPSISFRLCVLPIFPPVTGKIRNVAVSKCWPLQSPPKYNFLTNIPWRYLRWFVFRFGNL